MSTLDNFGLYLPALCRLRGLMRHIIRRSLARRPQRITLMQSLFIGIEGQSGLSQWSILDPYLQQTLMNTALA